MLKIVWITASRFTEEKIKGTGTWIISLAEQMHKSGKVDIILFSLVPVDNIIKEHVFGIPQYVFPNVSNRCVSKETGLIIEKELDKIRPDIIHIWGTESNISTLFTKGYIKYPSFVDLQGFMPSIPVNITKGLSVKELIKAHFGIREILHPRISLYFIRREYQKKSEMTLYVLSKFKFVSVQSKWVEAQISAYFPNIKIVNTNIILREEFYQASKWKYHEKKRPTIFTCASSTLIPYKGLYTLLKGLMIVKSKYPNVLLRIAGIPIRKRRKTGFERIIHNFIIKNNLIDNIEFIGPLDAESLVSELQESNICVVPSYVETYCLALAEAQMIGIPCVVSYAGAMPEIAKPDEEALFYDPLDYHMMAFQIKRLLSNRELCIELSTRAIEHREKDNDKDLITENQIKNYYTIIEYLSK